MRQLFLDVDDIPIPFFVVLRPCEGRVLSGKTAQRWEYLAAARAMWFPNIDDATHFSTRERAAEWVDEDPEVNGPTVSIGVCDPNRDRQCHDCRVLLPLNACYFAEDPAGMPRLFCETCRRSNLADDARWEEKKAARAALRAT